MKLLHISDLHLGLRLMNRDLSADQRYVLGQIVRQAAEVQPDAVLIAGDIYDKSDQLVEAVILLNDFISDLTAAAPESEIMIISGNHDSAPRLDLYRSILARHKIHMIGIPPREKGEHIAQVTLSDEYGPVHFYLLPYVKPTMIKAIVGTEANGNNLSYEESLRRLFAAEGINTCERNVLVSHQFYIPAGQDAGAVDRAASEITTVGNIDSVSADIIAPFDYAALGHIHKPWALDEFHRYCGTPLACSVSEAGQKKGSVLVTLGPKGSITTTVLPLSPLHEVRIITGSLADVLRQGCDDYVSVRLTDTETDGDAQERIRAAFPNLLEWRRDFERIADYNVEFSPEEEQDPYNLCKDFLGDLDAAEQAFLQDIINTVQGGKEQ